MTGNGKLSFLNTLNIETHIYVEDHRNTLNKDRRYIK